MESFREMFPANFMPHGHCYLWKQDLLFLHIFSDALIMLSYYSIPIALFMFIKKRQDLSKISWVFHLFAVFIFLCGTTHLMEIYAVWYGDYYLTGFVKALTAIASLLTAIKVIPLIPKFINIPAEAFTAEKQRELMENLAEKEKENDALKEQLKFYGNLFDSVPHPTVVVNHEGIIENINTKGLEVFGYKKNDLLQKEVEVLIPDRFKDDHPEKRNTFFKSPKLRPMGSNLELYALQKDSEEFPVEVALSPFESDGQLKVIATIVDISDRKEKDLKILMLNSELEFRVKKRTEELELANKELESFSYTVSHDLRAPLRHISGFLEVITKSITDGENTRLIQLVQESVKSMGVLIDDLLHFSRTSRQELTYIKIDMNDVIRNIIREIEETESNTHIEWSVDSDLIPIYGDLSLIKQVWANLINNSVKYSKPKGNVFIEIKSFKDNHFINYSIKDNGVGFDNSLKDKVFKVFERLHSDNEFEGTGIGLAIVKKVIDRHNGEITVNSELDKGTEFLLSFKETHE